MLKIPSLRQMLQWRVLLVGLGATGGYVSHDACRQYEEMLDGMDTAVDVSTAAGRKELQRRGDAYGFFEGYIQCTEPFRSPSINLLEHYSRDLALMQHYECSNELAQKRFSKGASVKDRVWVINPPTRRKNDSGLQIGGELSIKQIDSDVEVILEKSFLPKMRLKQLFSCKCVSSTNYFGVDDYSLMNVTKTSADEGETVCVVGGLPVNQRVCIMGDFSFRNIPCNDQAVETNIHTKDSIFVSSRAAKYPNFSFNDEDNFKRIYGSFFGSFEEVRTGKVLMYEMYQTYRLMGGLAVAAGFLLMLIP